VESCPNCHFLMRDDAVECGVCHTPRMVVVTEGLAVVDDTRVGLGHSTGLPVALVVLTGLLLAVGAAFLAIVQHWV